MHVLSLVIDHLILRYPYLLLAQNPTRSYMTPLNLSDLLSFLTL